MKNLSRQTAIPIPYQALAAFCEAHHIRRLWLFGSVLRDDFTPESDVDVLVEFDPAHIPAWEFYGAWTQALSRLFGRSVDLSTPDSLRARIKPRIMASAEVIYESSE